METRRLARLCITMDKKYFLLRLLPPRASFTQDMTPEERAVMQAHVAYWAPYIEMRTMIVMGPVADPAGGWGLGVIGVERREELDTLLKNDPASTLGHWEVFPMLGIKYK